MTKPNIMPQESAAITALRGPLSQRATSAEFNEWMARKVVEHIDAQAERIEELEDHISDLLVDLPCACGHDNPGDVCLKHMPKFRAAQERIKELEAEVERVDSLWSQTNLNLCRRAEKAEALAKTACNDALREAAHECEQVAYSGKYPQDDQSELGCLRCRDNILARIEGDTND